LLGFIAKFALEENHHWITTMTKRHLIFGQATDIGKVRAHNEDAIFSMVLSAQLTPEMPEIGLFIIADGGGERGDEAASVAVLVIANHLLDNIINPLLMEREILVDPKAIREAVQIADKKIYEDFFDSEAILSGTGATLTLALIVADELHIGHVGHTRCYHADTQIEQLTRDHRFVTRLVELDRLTPEEAEGHLMRGVVYQILGSERRTEVDIISKPLSPNSQVILCSDGLWTLVKEPEMVDIVTSALTPQAACDKLVALANERGGTDNISVIVVRRE
jgi:protein phosphatase